MNNMLIIGATSGIAIAYARLKAKENAAFFLVARDEQKLTQTAQDLITRGANSVSTFVLDINQLQEHQKLIAQCQQQLGNIDIALIAYGSLPNQKTCQDNTAMAMQEFTTNGTSTIALLNELANVFEKQQQKKQHSGTIAVITSVAGDRGRPSNYLYGSAKAAVSTFCEGLRARLFKVGVHLLDIRPGFVDTPMTQGLNLPKLLLATPEAVAIDIDKAIRKQKNVLYTPWFWRWILLIVRMIPQSIYKKLHL
jgi:decaprenylphospho-beta-D-erythro-pentofuranosid-2-ulose 2-reductase